MRITAQFLLLLSLGFCANSKANEFGGQKTADWVGAFNTISSIAQQNNVSAVGLIVVDAQRDHHIYTAGTTGHGLDEDFAPHHYIRLGSITKSFTGLALLHMQEQGLLSLNDPIPQTINGIPLYRPTDHEHAEITYAQLLEHTAGLGDLVKAEWDHNQPLTLADALRLAPNSRSVRWPPGRYSSYSNSGAGVSAFAAQTKTGKHFESYVIQHIAVPIGMRSATFRLDNEVRRDLISGYDRDGVTPIPYWHTLYRTFGGLNARFSDMGRYVQFLLDRGRVGSRTILPPSAIERLERPETTLAARQGLTFGYGLGIYSYVRDGKLFHGHGGDADGYLTFIGYNSAANTGYFLVINAFQNTTLRKMRSVVETKIASLANTRNMPGVPQASEHLAKLQGEYKAVTARFGQASETFSIVFAEGRLYRQNKGRREHLIPTSAWLFRRSYEPMPSMAFIPTSEGMELQGTFGNFRRVTTTHDSKR